MTREIIKNQIKKNNCIDIGCHKGEILKLMIHAAPQGQHYASEPIPSFYHDLESTFGKTVSVFPYAVAEYQDKTTFNVVENASAYSGLMKRKYNLKNPILTEIQVEVMPLDSIIPEDVKIHFIKIDVEGGEFGVLKRGMKLIKRCNPLILFEFGMGASEFYGTTPSLLFNFFDSGLSYNIFL